MNKNQSVPTEAWINSLTRVLLWPFCVWAFLGLFGLLLWPGSLVFLLFVGGVGCLIHFMAYFVMGLPFYHLFWDGPEIIWTYKVGLPLGAGLGGLALGMIHFFLASPSGSLDGWIWAAMIGGGYGLVTATAAILSRRRK